MILAWAREHTPKDALFYMNTPAFRYYAGRSLTHSLRDVMLYTSLSMVDDYRRYQRLEGAYTAPGSLAREAQALKVDYIVIEKSRPVRLEFSVVFENDKYLVYQPTTPAPSHPAPKAAQP